MRINLTDPRLSPTASCLSKRGRRPKPTPLACLVVKDAPVGIVDDIATAKRLNGGWHLPRRVDDRAPTERLHRCRHLSRCVDDIATAKTA